MVKKIAFEGSRLLLGLIFLVFGLNGFLQFIPMPPPNPEMGAFMGALAASGFFFPLVKITEIAVGLLLLSNFFVPLALVVISPIVVNIFAIHLFLDPAGMPMAVALVVLTVLAAAGRWGSFAELLKPKSDAAGVQHHEHHQQGYHATQS